jgi:hypothetical protein
MEASVYCPKCGAVNPDDARVCTSCGNNLQGGGKGGGSAEEGVGPVGILLFCIPIVGIIMYFVWKDDKPKKAQTACYLALAGAAVIFVLQVLGVLAGMVGGS